MRYFVWFVTILALTFLLACEGSVVQEKAANSNNSANKNGADAAPKIKQLSDFELKMLEGNGDLKPRKLSQTLGQGKVVVIDFWATWCKPCLASIPDLNALNNEYREKGVQIYGLSIEDPDEGHRTDPTTNNLKAVIEMSKRLQINYQVGFAPDGMLATFDQRRTGGIPQTFIFGKDGNLVMHMVGFNPNQAPKMIRESIDKALNS
jgi:thiol-disulfide isomerase/thioredoxin